MAIVAIAVIAAPLWSTIFPVGPNEPYIRIQRAIEQASDGDTISVKSGTESDPLVYEEQIDFMGKDILVAAREVGATSPYQIDSPNPLATVIKLPDTLASSDEASVVYFRNGESQNAELRGFTITNGRGTLARTYIPDFGSDLNPIQNYAYIGGGIFIRDASPSIRHCIISGNSIARADYSGGGAGIYSDNSSATIYRCTISNNTIQVGANQVGVGGGLYIVNYSKLVLNSCEITGNYCLCDSTCLGTAGGGIAVISGSSPKIFNSRITQNHSSSIGGGLFLSGSFMNPPIVTPVLKRNYIISNRVYGVPITFETGGAGIFLRNCNAKIANNMIGSNVSTKYGGGVTIALSVSDADISIVNNTIYKNKALDASGVYILSETGSAGVGKVTLKNNIIFRNDTGGVFMKDTVTIDNDNNNWFGNALYNFRGIIPGPHSISADPLMDLTFHLTSESPCIDAGDNCAWYSFPATDWDYDIDGEFRIRKHGTEIKVDIGADETSGIPLRCGDENVDGTINVTDVIYLFSNLYANPDMPVCPYYLGDVNGDCDVNITDVVVLFENLYAPQYLHCPGEDDCEQLPLTLSNGVAELSFGKPVTTKDRTYRLPIYLQNSKPVAGTQLEISYDPEEWEMIGAYSSGRATDFMLVDGMDYKKYSFAQLCPLDKIEKGLAPGKGQIAEIEIKWLGSGTPDFNSIEINKTIVVNSDGREMIVNNSSNTIAGTNDEKVLPSIYGISSVIPNPFDNSTTIRFSIPEKMRVSLILYNAAGQKIKTLIDKDLPAGYHTVTWNGTDKKDRLAPQGIYFLVMQGNGQRAVKKITLLR